VSRSLDDTIEWELRYLLHHKACSLGLLLRKGNAFPMIMSMGIVSFMFMVMFLMGMTLMVMSISRVVVSMVMSIVIMMVVCVLLMLVVM
jgi:hypothetical protein